MSSKHPLKKGEKIMLMVFGVFFGFAILTYIALETVRLKSDEPLWEQTTHFDFSDEGRQGSQIYRVNRCNSCHRALRTGTSMGLILDGIGSRRSQEWLEAFLADPEALYGAPTLDHGKPPKEAAYVAQLPAEDRRLIAVFLSELRADPGSAVAPAPPPGDSAFIERMLRMWAPDSWEERFTDVREPTEDGAEAMQEEGAGQ